VDALEPFDPTRMVSRILGMGDVLGLIAMAEVTVEREQAEELARKLRRADFTLEDYRDQMKQLRKMGPLDQVLSMIPGMSSLKGVDVDRGEQELRRTIAIIDSMTPQERNDPSVINGSRRKRISRGSGSSVEGDEAPRRPHAAAPIKTRKRKDAVHQTEAYGLHEAALLPRGGGRLAGVAGRELRRGARALRSPPGARGGEDRRGAGEALDGPGRQGHRHRPQPAQAERREGLGR
jgi:hypothetical protein